MQWVFVGDDFRVTGADQLGALARRIRAEGDAGKGLRRELLRELRAAAVPARDAAREAILAWETKPPDDRGLRREIARNIRVRVRLSGKRIGVRVSVGKVDGTNLPRRINKGVWRHPVFGNPDVWVTQAGDRGWFDRTERQQTPAVRRRLSRAMQRVSRRITSG